MAKLTPERQRTLALHARVFAWACGVLKACPAQTSHLASREIWRQLVRAASSASNNLVEADEASSTADFIAKMKIALREARESRNNLRFVVQCRLTNHERLRQLPDEARQIAAIFATILITVKERHRREQEAKRRAQGGEHPPARHDRSKRQNRGEHPDARHDRLKTPRS